MMQVYAPMAAGSGLSAPPRRFSHGAVLSRLWEAIQTGRQRRLDHEAAQAVYALGHEGVSEDYRAATRLR